MDKEIYNFTFNKEDATFQFDSIGPKGKIRKLISYILFDRMDDGTPVLNLAFGDLEGDDQNISDTVVSNNSDRDKVLATVARTVLHIIDSYNKVGIIAQGSTPSRTRLYQISINAYKEEIDEHFEVKGLTDKGWEIFKKGTNYSSFLATKKV
ncbi:hypothetical protein SIO70_13855 [Chitinophaga sancti]|uniref:DUF6934 family protein n=1 Tax=Chitinophaga sancti TaxID=1004 RepID=UPI002A7573DC|nr:hypothetical protein [Chitinophaga sancti]WPQ65941.1 hypothetical protein SIO70_13855 [Chitinophaga sancti]